MAEYKKIRTDLLAENRGQIEGLPKNPRQWTRTELDALKKSIQETPELLDARGCIVVKDADRYVVLGGNMRLAACRELGMDAIPCYVLPEGTPADKLKEIVIKDNGSFGAWDFDMLANEWDHLDLSGWGINVPEHWLKTDGEEMDSAEIARKKKKFEEKMAAGEISEDDEEYQAFCEKFLPKKTTDDCYTPPLVYDAVRDYVCRHYGLNARDFVRPFFPGGDYQKENYPAGCVVVDNPPFSILARIIKFYASRRVKFFLFAPTLTLFSSQSTATALPLAVAVTYENGACVNTSFLTNLDPPEIRLRSAPDLYQAVKKANAQNLKAQKTQLPKYSFNDHVITATRVGTLSRLGIEFSVPVAESVRISGLDSQKAEGRGIYGSGYLVSAQVAADWRERVLAEKAERELAELERTEREKAERVVLCPLSDRERRIVAELTAAGAKMRHSESLDVRKGGEDE